MGNISALAKMPEALHKNTVYIMQWLHVRMFSCTHGDEPFQFNKPTWFLAWNSKGGGGTEQEGLRKKKDMIWKRGSKEVSESREIVI